jgi:hypothetical protein
MGRKVMDDAAERAGKPPSAEFVGEMHSIPHNDRAHITDVAVHDPLAHTTKNTLSAKVMVHA